MSGGVQYATAREGRGAAGSGEIAATRIGAERRVESVECSRSLQRGVEWRGRGDAGPARGSAGRRDAGATMAGLVPGVSR